MEVRVAAQRVLVQADVAIVDDDQVKGVHCTGDLRVMDFVVILYRLLQTGLQEVCPFSTYL